jgi:hypothetical protein
MEEAQDSIFHAIWNSRLKQGSLRIPSFAPSIIKKAGRENKREEAIALTPLNGKLVQTRARERERGRIGEETR